MERRPARDVGLAREAGSAFLVQFDELALDLRGVQRVDGPLVEAFEDGLGVTRERRLNGDAHTDRHGEGVAGHVESVGRERFPDGFGALLELVRRLVLDQDGEIHAFEMGETLAGPQQILETLREPLEEGVADVAAVLAVDLGEALRRLGRTDLAWRAARQAGKLRFDSRSSTSSLGA